MAGEAFGVGNDDAIGRVTEGLAQGVDLGRGAAAAGRGIGLMRHEDRLRGDGVAVETEAALGGRNQVVHHHADVLHVQPRAVEGAVVRLAAQQFDDAAHAALAHGVLALDDQATGTHAHDRAVAAAVEGQSGLGDLILGRGRAHGQEARADPLHQMLAGHIVAADHNHAAATAAADPILGDGDGLGRAGAGGVDLRVGAARADVLGELAVAHRQDAEQEAPVKDVRLALQRVAQCGDAPVEFVQRRFIRGVGAQVFQHRQLLHPVAVGVVAGEFVGETVAARKGAGEDDAGLVAQRFGQHPAFG